MCSSNLHLHNRGCRQQERCCSALSHTPQPPQSMGGAGKMQPAECREAIPQMYDVSLDWKLHEEGSLPEEQLFSTQMVQASCISCFPGHDPSSYCDCCSQEASCQKAAVGRSWPVASQLCCIYQYGDMCLAWACLPVAEHCSKLAALDTQSCEKACRIAGQLKP